MGRFVQVWWPVGLAIAFGCVGFMAGRENAHKTLKPLANEQRARQSLEVGMLGYGFCPTWRAATDQERTAKQCSLSTKDTPHE